MKVSVERLVKFKKDGVTYIAKSAKDIQGVYTRHRIIKTGEVRIVRADNWHDWFRFNRNKKMHTIMGWEKLKET